MIIGLTGFKGVGKSTVAQYMCDAYDFTRIGFSDPPGRQFIAHTWHGRLARCETDVVVDDVKFWYEARIIASFPSNFMLRIDRPGRDSDSSEDEVMSIKVDGTCYNDGTIVKLTDDVDKFVEFCRRSSPADRGESGGTDARETPSGGGGAAVSAEDTPSSN